MWGDRYYMKLDVQAKEDWPIKQVTTHLKLLLHTFRQWIWSFCLDRLIRETRQVQLLLKYLSVPSNWSAWSSFKLSAKEQFSVQCRMLQAFALVLTYCALWLVENEAHHFLNRPNKQTKSTVAVPGVDTLLAQAKKIHLLQVPVTLL